EYLCAVLADSGRGARRHLFVPGEEEGAVDRPQLRVIGIGLQETGSQHLLVMAYIVDPADHTKVQPDLVELLAPVRKVVLSEQFVEDRHQFTRVLVAAGIGRETLS